MRLVTMNLLGGRGVPADLERFLRVVRPDVVCAQEVGHDAGRILERWYPYGRVEPAFRAMGRALVASVPVDVDDVPMPFRSGLTTTLPAECALGGARLIGVHLANPIDPFTGPSVRRGQLRALVPLLAGDDPLIVAGDMNATPIWPAYRRLAGHLSDLVEEHADRSGVTPPRTWAKRPGGAVLLRIDHVFGRGVVAKRVDVDRLIGVDHLPVIVDLVRP